MTDLSDPTPEKPSQMRMVGVRLPKASHAQLDQIRAETKETITQLFTRLIEAEYVNLPGLTPEERLQAIASTATTGRKWSSTSKRLK